jgi:hypothetical protein
MIGSQTVLLMVTIRTYLPAGPVAFDHPLFHSEFSYRPQNCVRGISLAAASYMVYSSWRLFQDC